MAPELESWMTPPPVPVERKDGGQAEQVGEPVQDVLLELGGRRAGHPGHALDAEAGGDQVAEDRGAGGVGREVAEEPGVLPVRRPGQDDPVEVGEDGRDRLALLRGGGRQGGADLAGGDLRAHREGLDPGPVVGDPVDDLVAVLPELLGSHVRCRLGHEATVSARRTRLATARGERSAEGVRRGGRTWRGTSLVVSDVAGPEGPRSRATQRLTPQRGTARGRGAIRRIAMTHSAPGATRTHTARVLNPLPLPIGVRGQAGHPAPAAAYREVAPGLRR